MNAFGDDFMQRNHKCRIHKDYVIKGYKALILENELIRMTILVDKGSDIIEFLYKPKDIDFMWKAPNGLISADNVISPGHTKLGDFLDFYEGGWQEIFPNGGSYSSFKGAELGQHGESSHLPWECEILKDTEEEISVSLTVKTRRTPYTVEKIITLKSNDSKVYFNEEFHNLADEDMKFMWGHHPALGEPFLSSNCIIKTSAQKVFSYSTNGLVFDNQRLENNQEFNWPNCLDREGKEVDLSKIPAKGSDVADMLYLKHFNEDAWYEVYNKELNLGFKMSWDEKIYPYLWLWLVCNAPGYPWYGRTYNLALEPWTSYPTEGLNEAINNKSACEIKKKSKLVTSYFVEVKDYDK